MTGINGTLVRLKNSQGPTITVPLERLSPADQKYVRDRLDR